MFGYFIKTHNSLFSDCKIPFTKFANHNANTATPYPEVREVEKCLDLCRENPDCIAVDYDRNEPPYKNAPCWIHTDKGIVMKPQPKVDHYVRGNLTCSESMSILT